MVRSHRRGWPVALLAACLLASSLLIGQSSPVSAHGSSGGWNAKWTQSDIYYCFVTGSGGPVGSVRKDMFRNAFDKWENILPDHMDFFESVPSFGICDIEIKEDTVHSNPGTVAQTVTCCLNGPTTLSHSGYVVLDLQVPVTITLYENWFDRIRYQTTAPDCYMTPPHLGGCKGDGYTIIVHEVGHALGLTHSPDSGDGWCVALSASGFYYHATDGEEACDLAGERVMNWTAGLDGWDWETTTDYHQGYRIGAFDQFTKDTIHSLYGS